MKIISEDSVLLNYSIENIDTGMIRIDYADKTGIICKFCIGDTLDLYIADKTGYIKRSVIITSIINNESGIIYITDKNDMINQAFINRLVYLYNTTNINYNSEVSDSIIITDPITGSDTGDVDTPGFNNTGNIILKNKGVGKHLLDVSNSYKGLYYIKSIIGDEGVYLTELDGDIKISIGVDTTELEMKKIIDDMWGEYK